MTDREVLLAAADLIERDGLHKRGYWRDWPRSYVPGKPCCAWGAIRVVAPTGELRGDAAVRLRAVVGSIPGWSDSHS